MYLLLFIFFSITIITLFLIAGIIPAKCTTDYRSPLNFVMFQEPKTQYSDQMVNLWVDKPWRADGKRIPCRIEEGYNNSVPIDQRTLIVYSHGNNENLLHCMQFMRELSNSLKVDAVCWDYSGYGLNDIDQFERTAEGMNLSLQTVLDHLLKDKGYSLENIIFWGYSLGSGPSTHLVAQLCQREEPPAGLILFGAYSSILDVVSDQTSPEVAKLFSERWDNASVIGKVTCPILLLHGQSDGLIKPSHAQRLKEKNPNAKLVLLPNTGHTQFSWGEAVGQVRRWLRESNLL